MRSETRGQGIGVRGQGSELPELTPDPYPLTPAKPLIPPSVDWSPYEHRLRAFHPVRSTGRVTQVVGLVVESEGPAAHLGDICHIRSRRNEDEVLAEVVGFRQHRLLLMPLGP